MSIKRMSSPEDPDRCQGVVPSKGQCEYKVMEGSEYCPLHGGNNAANKIKKESLSNYRLGIWQARLERQTDNPALKNLRDEIGILRIIMEETLLRCETPFDLIASSQKISDLALKITMVVEKCHRLEGSMGQLLDKKTVIQMANVFIEILAAEDLSEDVLDRIAKKVLESVSA